MVVNSADIGMRTTYRYQSSSKFSAADVFSSAGKATSNYQTYESNYSKEASNGLISFDAQSPTYSREIVKQKDKAETDSVNSNSLSSLSSQSYSLVSQLLEIFLGHRRDLLEKLREQFGLASGSGGTTEWTRTYTEESSYEEHEEMSFSTQGTAFTEDGRALSFNVNVSMSRSFFSQTGYTISESGTMLTDPLTIWLDDNPETISDQSFRFDLDCDGQEESIPMLNQGKGFLAYDANQDGIINDGSELFGARSGDGFGELAAYDKDGNGFIDEADDIFDKLSVWHLDKDGNAELIPLLDADVGAIYLGNVKQDFSINDDETNETKGRIRSNGVYLKESGGAGVIQQIDLKMQKQ